MFAACQGADKNSCSNWFKSSSFWVPGRWPLAGDCDCDCDWSDSGGVGGVGVGDRSGAGVDVEGLTWASGAKGMIE